VFIPVSIGIKCVKFTKKYGRYSTNKVARFYGSRCGTASIISTCLIVTQNCARKFANRSEALTNRESTDTTRSGHAQQQTHACEFYCCITDLTALETLARPTPCKFRDIKQQARLVCNGTDPPQMSSAGGHTDEAKPWPVEFFLAAKLLPLTRGRIVAYCNTSEKNAPLYASRCATIRMCRSMIKNKTGSLFVWRKSFVRDDDSSPQPTSPFTFACLVNSDAAPCWSAPWQVFPHSPDNDRRALRRCAPPIKQVLYCIVLHAEHTANHSKPACQQDVHRVKTLQL